MAPGTSKIFITVALAAILGSVKVYAQDEAFTVVLDEPVNGTFTLSPPLPADGKYPAGTVVTVSATPDAGYVLDSGYYSVPGRFGAMYHETMKSPFEVVIDQDKHIGASFIEKSEVDHIDVTQNVVFAEFMDALVEAGQRVEYVQVGGASHAFFDWKPDARTKATFARYGVYYAAEMKAFFASILN